MPAEATPFILFCEDTRDEVGGKSSIIGIYGPVIAIDESPTRLARLRAVALVALKEAEVLETSLSVVVRGDNAPGSPPPFKGRITRQRCAIDRWNNQIVAILDGVPVQEGTQIDVSFVANGVAISASLSVLLSSSDAWKLLSAVEVVQEDL